LERDNVDMATMLLDVGAQDPDYMIATAACKDPRRIEVLRLMLQRFPDPGSRYHPLLFEAIEADNFEVSALCWRRCLVCWA
jgi:hypothetical protein